MSDAGIERGQTRADGRTVADTVAEEQASELLADIEEANLDIERSRQFSSLSFSRMRTSWRADQMPSIHRMHVAVDAVMLNEFGGAYQLMNDLFDAVREVEVDEDTGEVLVDDNGFPVWSRNPTGSYIEDWSRLTTRQRENFLFGITTNLWEWQQIAANMWGEAMMAKAVWQETFSHFFNEQERGTVDHRTARGNLGSAEDRYFAVYVSLLSRKAEALVQSLERLGQRVKDTMDL